MLFRKILIIFLLLISCLGCNNTAKTKTDSKLKVTVSIVPFASIAGRIAGDKADIAVIVPPGANPHVFEPSPSQLANLSKSDIFIFMGLGFEFWKDKFTQSASNPSLISVELSENMDVLQDPGFFAESAESVCCKHSHNLGNPHMWTSPKRVLMFLDKIESAFCKADPNNTYFYKSNADSFRADLIELDKKCEKLSVSLKNKKFLSQHAAWIYFAEDYGFEQSGVIEEFPGKEPSPAHIKNIIDTAKKTNTKVIFTDLQFSPKAAQAVAEDGNLKVVSLDPIGSESISYIELMEQNLEKIGKALR